MRQVEENFLSMCKAVQDVLKTHEAVWMSQVAFAEQVMTFQSLLVEMSDALVKAEIVTTGATVHKSNAKLSAIRLAVDLASRGSVYARSVENWELSGYLKTSKSLLLKRADMLTLSMLRNIHFWLMSVVTELEDYAVDMEALNQLNSHINAYEAVIARPRMLILERKGMNQHVIPLLFKKIRRVLSNLDHLVNVFHGTALPSSYQDARIIIDMGGRKNDTNTENMDDESSKNSKLSV